MEGMDGYPIFLTTPQAAKLLGVCDRRVYEWAARAHAEALHRGEHTYVIHRAKNICANP